MPSEGAGSRRIVLVGRHGPAREVAPAEQAPPPQPAAREEPRAPRRPAEHARAPREPVRQSGWTTRRLTLGAAMGAAATIAGAALFATRFGALGGESSPLLAGGFGLFAIGMIVFCACLIALIGIGVAGLAERRGWRVAAPAVTAPLALVWALWALGVAPYAVPAVLSLVLIAGLLVALK